MAGGVEAKAQHLMQVSREHYGDLGVPYVEEWYSTMFEPFYVMPTEARFDYAITNLTRVIQRLSVSGGDSSDPVTDSPIDPNEELTKINSVSDELVEWTGDAAETFRDHVKTPFPAKVGSMFNVACVLKGALEAEAAMWRQIDADVHELLDNAIASVESLDDCDPKSGTTAIGIVLAIASIPVTGPAGATVLAALAAGNTIVQGGIEQDTGGNEPMTILPKVKEGVEKIKRDIVDAETLIKDALTGITDWMSGNADKYTFQRGRVGLDNGPGGLGNRR